jgi:hypothetical protein
MTEADTVDLDLILPAVPEISTSYDVGLQVDVTSSDTECMRNIKVSLVDFSDITTAFMDANRAAWTAEGEDWPEEGDFKLDGYTLFFELELSDTNAGAICVQ